MKRFLVMVFVVNAILLFGLQGCAAKKIAKIETPPAPSVSPAAPTPAPVAEPSDNDSFKIGAMDEKIKKILVPVYFEYDKFDLRKDAIGTLEKITQFLNDNPSVRIVCEGSADERGSAEYNMGLGDNRARAVKTYLTGYGISGSRLETTSWGKERPAFPNCGEDESCHSKNRRVEFKVLAK
ncbi:MAG: OmpA family protein [Chitinivibrionales bacterium]|nr:OmpA family protein [Chitinivibrionales bacterium]